VIVGVTGNRGGLSAQQHLWLISQIKGARALHHGACVGADTDAHLAARDAGVAIIVHPPTDMRLVELRDTSESLVHWLQPLPYMERNHNIVNACDVLWAFPSGPERVRSGTWATVRYAVKNKKTVVIVHPLGTVEVR